jgi:hypothetical protein
MCLPCSEFEKLFFDERNLAELGGVFVIWFVISLSKAESADYLGNGCTWNVPDFSKVKVLF